jgi:hypothetical protein
VSRNNIEPPRWSPFAAAGEVIFYFANPLIDHCRLSRVDFTAQYFFRRENLFLLLLLFANGRPPKRKRDGVNSKLASL